MSDKKVIPLHDPKFKGDGGGVVGFISYGRLESIFRSNGEVRNNERVVGYVVEDDGITFYIEENA